MAHLIAIIIIIIIIIIIVKEYIYADLNRYLQHGGDNNKNMLSCFSTLDDYLSNCLLPPLPQPSV